jgi:Fe-S-cluster containining protein
MRSMTATPDLVPGRTCEGCTLCCKLLAVDVLEKPRAKWCAHCDPKRDCTIYESRPEACRAFYCGYLRIKELDEGWKPAKAKFLVNYEARSNRIAIHADPDRPDAWRVEPFHSTIRAWARNAAREGGSVIVWRGDFATLVLPEADKDLGRVRDDQFIVPVERKTRAGVVPDFAVVDADDPRVRR